MWSPPMIDLCISVGQGVGFKVQALGVFHAILLLGAVLGEVADSSAHHVLEKLLARYVVESGVDYAAWKRDPLSIAGLSSYVDQMEATDPESLSRDDQLAYWINLYNAATLELVLAHYPVPSIRDIGGPEGSPWKRPLVEIGGHVLTLDEIENEVLRPRFSDPRIHFALNCAAIGCPPLRSFAFEGSRIDAQLEMVTREALRDPRVLDEGACGAKGGKIRLSRIFDWYAEDFGELRAFLGAHVDRQVGAAWPATCELEFMDYDWALNEASSSP